MLDFKDFEHHVSGNEKEALINLLVALRNKKYERFYNLDNSITFVYKTHHIGNIKLFKNDYLIDKIKSNLKREIKIPNSDKLWKLDINKIKINLYSYHLQLKITYY